MITFTKEQLIASAHARIEFAEMMLAGELEPLKERTWSIELELARIALASLDAKPVGYTDEEELRSADNDIWMWKSSHGFGKDIPLYTLPPAPVVPEALLFAMEEVLRISDREHEAWNKVKIGIASYLAAMLQDGTFIDEGTIPATRFQQVADLYGITSPTGSETSFTFDAFEASGFAKGGWSVQEYVELERYQDAVTGNSPVIGVDLASGPDRTVEVRYVAPPGYVMVPKEPTEAMINAWLSEVANWRGHAAGYKAALAAAPQQESE